MNYLPLDVKQPSIKLQVLTLVMDFSIVILFVFVLQFLSMTFLIHCYYFLFQVGSLLPNVTLALGSVGVFIIQMDKRSPTHENKDE